MRALAVIGFVVAFAGASAAQPAPQSPPSDDELAAPAALALSFGGTVASYTLLVYTRSHEQYGGDLKPGIAWLGAGLAPSFGHWYAGTFFTRGLGVRASGLTLALVGGMVGVASGCPGVLLVSECTQSELGGGVAAVMVVGGVIAWVGGTLDDILQAPKRAARHNARRRFSLSPMLIPGGGGLALGGEL